MQFWLDVSTNYGSNWCTLFLETLHLKGNVCMFCNNEYSSWWLLRSKTTTCAVAPRIRVMSWIPMYLLLLSSILHVMNHDHLLPIHCLDPCNACSANTHRWLRIRRVYHNFVGVLTYHCWSTFSTTCRYHDHLLKKEILTYLNLEISFQL